MTKPHVAYVVADPGIDWRSAKGAAVHVREMVRAMCDIGCRVSVVTTRGVASIGEDEPEFARLEACRAVDRHFGAAPREERPGALREIRTLAKMPVVADAVLALDAADRIDVVYERYSLWSDVGARVSGELGVPLVVEMNAPLIDEQTSYRSLALTDVAEHVLGRTMSSAERIVVVSRALEHYLAARGIDRERVRILPNTAERERFFRSPHRAPAPGEPFTVGFLGSLKPWHGVEQFLDVFATVHAAHPNCRLEIVGDSRHRASLEEWVRANELGGAVRFLGHVEHERVPEILERWDLAVAPYPDLPGFYFSPLKLAEALAAGRPVMAAGIGDIPEMLGNGDHGVLVPPSDWQRWTQALTALVTDPSKLSPLADAAERHSRDWSWRTHAAASLEGLVMNGAPPRELSRAAD